jgi:hypothetical protein
MRTLVTILISAFAFGAHALQLPKGLSAADRADVVQTIGLGTAPKMLTNPYPLGGYSGFEVGYEMDFINVRDVNHLGCSVGTASCPNNHVPDEDEFHFSRFTIGKGLYHDVDVFFSFAPPIGSTNVSDFGAMARWAFYQAEFLPITFSFILDGNRMNIGDDFVGYNVGAELMLGITVDSFALYFGAGQIWSRGTFLVYTDPTNPGNGTVSSTDPEAGNTGSIIEDKQQLHAVVGFSVQYENLFSAAEIDHYHDSVYSIKVGTRF